MLLEPPCYPSRAYGPWDIIVYCCNHIEPRRGAGLVLYPSLPELYTKQYAVYGFYQAKYGLEHLRHTIIGGMYLRVYKRTESVDTLMYLTETAEAFWPNTEWQWSKDASPTDEII